jgi:SAM-dependent methyltransferase
MSKQLAKRILPIWTHGLFRRLYVSAKYLGIRVKCPCCGSRFRGFLPFGAPARANAKCPRCGCLERHRLLVLFLKNRTNFFTDSLRVLEFAPVLFLQRTFERLRNLEYVSADIRSRFVMLRMDITRIPLPENYFDCVICYHVLQQVRDDQTALKELFRVLTPGGWAILQSPVDHVTYKTLEPDREMLPDEAERLFGDGFAVRKYGLDYKERLEAAGFVVELNSYARQLGDDEIARYGLMDTEVMYICSKPKHAT